MKTYTITLPDEIAEIVEKAVAAGKFEDSEHFFWNAVMALQNELQAEAYEDKEWLKREIQIGLDQSARGEVGPLDMAAIWAKVK